MSTITFDTFKALNTYSPPTKVRLIRPEWTSRMVLLHLLGVEKCTLLAPQSFTLITTIENNCVGERKYFYSNEMLSAVLRVLVMEQFCIAVLLLSYIKN